VGTAAYLSEAIGIDDSRLFRGRALNMTGQAIARSVGWPELHTNDRAILDQSGNAMRLAGLTHFGVPVFFEYSPNMTPAFYAVATRLLALPVDRQMRNVTVLRRVDSRVLAMLGVRFVITDAGVAPSDDVRPVGSQEGPLYLYEVNDVNVGDYSPTAVTVSRDAAETLRTIADAQFDPGREVVANSEIDAPRLSQASDVALSFDGTAFDVKARSQSNSIIVLPVEFSRCLTITSARSGSPKLFRANLAETGVLFSGDLDMTLAIRWGPFLNSTCRLRDLYDVNDLGIGRVPPIQ